MIASVINLLYSLALQYNIDIYAIAEKGPHNVYGGGVSFFK